MSSCNTPKEYFNRPKVNLCIANGDGTAFCNGNEVSSKNMICGDSSDYEVILKYFEDKEFRLYRCLKYNRCY